MTRKVAAFMVMGAATVAGASTTGGTRVWSGVLTSQATLQGQISVSVVQPYIKFTAASAVAEPTPISGQNVMDGSYVGYVASAPAYQDVWSEGVAYLRISSGLKLRVSWDTGQPLREPISGATLGTSFEMRHRGVWDYDHPNAPYAYGTYKGLVANPYTPSGYGVSGWRGTNLRGLNEWLQVNDPYFTPWSGEIWVRGRIYRNGLSNPPGIYTQTSSSGVYTPLTVTISAM